MGSACRADSSAEYQSKGGSPTCHPFTEFPWLMGKYYFFCTWHSYENKGVVPVPANWNRDDIQPSNKPHGWNLIVLWIDVVPVEKAWSADSGNNRYYGPGYVRTNKCLLNSGNSPCSEMQLLLQRQTSMPNINIAVDSYRDVRIDCVCYISINSS